MGRLAFGPVGVVVVLKTALDLVVVDRYGWHRDTLYESEADLLGLEYMYKSGYDPGAFVDFFEKIQSLEKKKPGTMAKVFSTHPMTDDRIRVAQKNIQEYLKERPEYVVTTSEFNDVKTRLMAIHNKRKLD